MRSIFARYIFLLSLIFAALGCAKSSQGTAGQLVSTSPNTTLTLNPAPVIVVLGRQAEEFPVSFDSKAQGTSAAFSVENLQTGRAVVFQVSQPGVLDTTISFPYTLGAGKPLILGALPSGTIEAIANRAIALKLVTEVNRQQSSILGLIDPSGRANCKGITNVDLVDLDGGIAVIKSGPFYFDDQGEIRNTAISDVLCTYAFFNIFPGSYRLRFFDQTGNAVSEAQVLGVTSLTSLGVSIP